MCFWVCRSVISPLECLVEIHRLFLERSHSEHQSAHFKLNLAITESSVFTQKSPAPLLECFCSHVVLSRVLLWLNALVITVWRSYLELPGPCAAALRTVCTLDAKFRALLSVLTLLKLLHVSDRVLDFLQRGILGRSQGWECVLLWRLKPMGLIYLWLVLLVCMWRGVSGLTVDITGMRPQRSQCKNNNSFASPLRNILHILSETRNLHVH